jgi:hypothetical protein
MKTYGGMYSVSTKSTRGLEKPRSPDITPLDFFLWGHIKSIVFRTPVNGLDELKTRIQNAISTIPADMLQRICQELEYRLDVIRATNGAHIEVY